MRKTTPICQASLGVMLTGLHPQQCFGHLHSWSRLYSSVSLHGFLARGNMKYLKPRKLLLGRFLDKKKCHSCLLTRIKQEANLQPHQIGPMGSTAQSCQPSRGGEHNQTYHPSFQSQSGPDKWSLREYPSFVVGMQLSLPWSLHYR